MREVQSYFGERVDAYRKSASHGDRADLDRMLAWIAPRPGWRALDVATGGGHTARALAGAGCEAIATDGTRAMLDGLGIVPQNDAEKAWRGRHAGLGLPALACDAQRLPFRRASFDVIASRIAPHHFPDLTLFAQECARVLRTDGRLYVFDLTTPEEPAAARLIDHIERLRDPSHGHSWSLAEWREALGKAGLRIERLERTSSDLALEPWIERARMPREREEELRRLLRETAPESIGGYGVTPAGAMRVLRVELLARA